MKALKIQGYKVCIYCSWNANHPVYHQLECFLPDMQFHNGCKHFKKYHLELYKKKLLPLEIEYFDSDYLFY